MATIRHAECVELQKLEQENRRLKLDLASAHTKCADELKREVRNSRPAPVKISEPVKLHPSRDSWMGY